MDGRQLDEVLGAVPLPMVLIGADERILEANPAAQALLGAGQIGRHHAIGLRQPALLSAIENALRRGIAGGAHYEVMGQRQKETYQVLVTPIRHDGRFEALCAFRDITEQELIGAFRRDFVANVGHELRSPLTTLVGIIETLKGPARNDAAARDRFLATMQNEAQRMIRLVRDLLSLSKAEADERRRPTARVDVAEMLRDLANTMRPVAEAAGVTLDIATAAAVPPVPADSDQLMQVIQNLVENAIKYDTRGKHVTLTLDPGEGEAMIRIDVTDRGEGIAPEHLPRLTERFYRVDDHRSREAGGTGLGLAIVKHIVNRHRGRLAISSERGTGTRFSVFLPKS